MYRLKENSFLSCLLILDLIVVVVSWSKRNAWFGWEYMELRSKMILALMWLILLVSLPGLAAIIMMKYKRLDGKRTYVALLYFSIFLCVINLISSIGWCITRYESAYFISIHPKASFQPAFLPIVFTIDTQGHITIEGSASIVTEIGTFSVGAEAETALHPTDSSLLLIIRHRQDNAIVDTVYSLATPSDQVVVVTHGITTTAVMQDRIAIDASAGDIQRIQINGTDQAWQSSSLSTMPLFRELLR